MTKVCGNTECVTRTCVSVVVDGAQRGQPRQPGRDLLVADLGAAEFAHHARHRPALAVPAAHAGGAELAAEGLGVGAVAVVEHAVQERRVRGVDADLHRLQPVAVPQALEGETVRGRRGEAVEGRQLRRRAALGAEVGEDHPGLHAQRIAALAHALAQRAARGFGRRLQAAPVDGEFPAVERAADALGFVARELEVGAAVRAVAVEQAPAAPPRRGTAPGPGPAGARPSAAARASRGRARDRIRPAAPPAASSGAAVRRKACPARCA